MRMRSIVRSFAPRVYWSSFVQLLAIFLSGGGGLPPAAV